MIPATIRTASALAFLTHRCEPHQVEDRLHVIAQRYRGLLRDVDALTGLTPDEAEGLRLALAGVSATDRPVAAYELLGGMGIKPGRSQVIAWLEEVGL